jgi:superfamily II DNA or RNA helicase
LPGQQEYVEQHAAKLARIWDGENDFFDVYDLTEAVKHEITQLRGDRPRPYSLPKRGTAIDIRMPMNVHLYDFQKEGIEAWFKAGRRGMFEMATGTGKTITSLAAATKLHSQVGALAVIVSAPFNHLVDQWAEEAARFGFVPLCCRDASSDWVPAVRSRVQDFNAGGRKSLFLITTHRTGSEAQFRSVVSRISGASLFIADEVHYLGSMMYRKALLESFNYRIGLSATPDRWFDQEGTDHLRAYFGATVVNMPLEKAIGRFLTPYQFVPHPVHLTVPEMDEFCDLSRKISKQIAMGRREESEKNTLLDKYLRDRAQLVAKAEGKLPLLQRLFQIKIRNVGFEGVKHTIVYCAPGETGTVIRMLADLGLRVHEFVYKVPNSVRVQLLRRFDAGDLQVLVAIKCLDEGVNIPATREAFFLASTSNPREFVQRRGRILRKAHGKERAVLHDLVVVPPPMEPVTKEDLEMYRVLVRKEMPRFAEFASAAENEFEAREVLFPLLLKLDLVHLFDLKPWDIYHQGNQWGDYGGSTDS